MRIGVAASGRFHLLDLARELDALGAEVSFYSYVTRKRASSFGLPTRCHVALFPFLFPLVAWERVFPRFLSDFIEQAMCWALDAVVILRMRKCDVFICMSGLYLQAPRYARWRYGARVHLHRSSQHILSQQEILASLPGARQVSLFMVQRELKGYAIADSIIVPSMHVVESFAKWPECAEKLYLNPLGVDVAQFPLRNSTPSLEMPTVLFVGQWSYRKGVDVLTSSIKRLPGLRLVHVGALSDAPFPTDPEFVHYDYVPQRKLVDFYRMAHVFVLPSREDGFGVVLSQALSCGLQVVCTDRTGGPDLAKLPGLARFIHVVSPDDSEALRQAILDALDAVAVGTGVAGITEVERETLGWRHYAARDLAFMREKLETVHKLPNRKIAS
jgi:alpha-maltose-1-phosphate synthase